MAGAAQRQSSRGVEIRIDRRWLVLAAVLIVGLLVRLWAMRWPPFPADMQTWIAWAERMRAGGPANFYEPGVFTDYAPGYMYVLWLTAGVKHLLFESAGTGTYHFLIRLPAVICDLATTALIFLVIDRAVRSRRPAEAEAGEADRWPLLAAFGAVCYALNPAVIINSSIWSQVDSVFTLLMMASLLLLIRDEAEAALVVYAIAFLVKPQAISIAPLVLAVLVLRYPWRRSAVAVGLACVVGFALIFPFWGWNAIPDLIRQLRGSTEAYEYTSLFTYNLWGVYGFWMDDSVALFGPLSVQGAGYLLYAIGLGFGVVLLVPQLRRGTDLTYVVFLFATYFTFLPVMVLTRMHERYLYPVLPFLLVFALLCQMEGERGEESEVRPRFFSLPLTVFVVLTVLHTINLYQVYEYYTHYDQGGPPITNRLFYNIADNAKVWCVFTLLTFTTLVVFLMQWLPEQVDQASPAPPVATSTPDPAPAT